MVDTIGKKLCQTRLARGLSLEEVAHATRMRPEKLIALENDDYSRFGSNAYAKGFLQIYGRFLGVDVSEQTRLMETPRQVSISDYQYLNNTPEPEPSRIQYQRREQRPSVAPLVIMLGLIVLAAITLATYTFQVTMERLEPSAAGRQAATAPTPAAATPAQTLPPATPATAESSVMPIPAIADPNSPPGNNPQPAANTEAVQTGGIGTAPIGSAVGSTPGTNELVVQPLRKTWVKIRRDSATATPIFEDYLYPSSRPLKLRGTSFYVEVRDQDSVQIRKNGHPIAYQAPGISIQ